MLNVREDMMNILSHVDFSKLFHFIKYFLELNPKCGKEEISIFLSNQLQESLNSRNILHEFESCVHQIETIT